MIKYMYPNVEAERARFGMSQDELVKKLNIERKTYYNWLTKGNIPAAHLIALANLFDCSTDYLLGRTRNPIIGNTTQPLRGSERGGENEKDVI